MAFSDTKSQRNIALKIQKTTYCSLNPRLLSTFWQKSDSIMSKWQLTIVIHEIISRIAAPHGMNLYFQI